MHMWIKRMPTSKILVRVFVCKWTVEISVTREAALSLFARTPRLRRTSVPSRYISSEERFCPLVHLSLLSRISRESYYLNIQIEVGCINTELETPSIFPHSPIN